MEEDNIIYGGSLSYRNMCRFNSGFFFRHPLLDKYRWYWRIEPDVQFHCDLDFDPFVYMQENNKVYGACARVCCRVSNSCDVAAFTIAMYEFEATIPTLWSTVKGQLDSRGFCDPALNLIARLHQGASRVRRRRQRDGLLVRQQRRLV